MKIEANFSYRWEKIVDKIYEQNETFDYKKTKKIKKEIDVFHSDLLRGKREVVTTLSLTDFNNNLDIKEELEETVSYFTTMEEYLNNFIEYEPTSKKGYYNYIKNIMGFL